MLKSSDSDHHFVLILILLITLIIKVLQYFDHLRTSTEGWKLCATDFSERIHKWVSYFILLLWHSLLQRWPCSVFLSTSSWAPCSNKVYRRYYYTNIVPDILRLKSITILCVHVITYMYIYMYIHACTCTCTCLCIYM